MRPPQTGVFGGVQQLRPPHNGVFGGVRKWPVRSGWDRSGPGGTGPVPVASPVKILYVFDVCAPKIIRVITNAFKGIVVA
jgi:hypothetical protein